MKIAWFTPFCTSSAIGRVGNVVTTALSRDSDCKVDIWTHQHENLQLTGLKVRHFDSASVSPRDLAGYDHLIYNFGNYLPYHLPILEVAQRHPGIVILHDYCMHHFFAGYYLTHLHSTAKYLDAVEDLYGSVGYHKAAQCLKGGSPLHESADVVDYPFWEPCVDNAKAVVAHSKFAAEIVRAKCHLPIANPSLPHFDYGDLEKVIPTLDRGRTGNDGKVHLLTVGHVNPNKRTHAVLDVLGRNRDLKDAVVFHVIGALNHQDYARSLREAVANYNLGDTVEFLGSQPDEVLHEYLCKANICVNLRHPIFETGSASLIEAMYFGLPTIVSDTGAYRDMPKSTVIHIPLQDEEKSLEQAIRTLVTDADRRRQLSQNAREHVRQHCTAEIYAEKLLEVLSLLPNDVDVRTRFLGRVKRELIEMGHTRGSSAVAPIAAEIARFWPS